MDINSFFEYIKGKRIALCGAGRTHIPLAKLFTEKGAEVTVRDRRDEEKIGEDAELIKSYGAKLVLGEDYLKNLDEDIIFRTPGMRYYEEELVKARENGQAVTSELEVFFDLCPCKIYGITGSDGKTTTTSIIAQFLKAEGKNVHLGGNIGNPLLPIIEEIDKNDVAVVELSSFQLISMRKSPDIAVMTNISPNHLDIHKDMQEYVDSKKNVFLHQNAFSRTVLNADDETTNSFMKETRGENLFFSRENIVQRGAYLNGDDIYVNGNKLMTREDIKIPGLHNVENYMAAICAVWGEVSEDNIIKTAREFAGVEHRAEFVRELDGVRYYNDSIATSPTRTMSGTLSLFDEKIILIAGGYDKNIPYDVMGETLNDKVKTLIVMGHTGPKIEKAAVESKNFDDKKLIIIRADNMVDAVNKAKDSAISGDIISLSPASAGFDLYKDFLERGNHFKEIVNSL